MHLKKWLHEEQKLLRYFYFPEKTRFQAAVDQSEHWRAFAVEDGSFTYEIAGKRGTAGAGNMIICPPNTLFARQNEQPISFHFFIFGWNGANGSPKDAKDSLNQNILTYRNQYRYFSTLSLLSSSTQWISNEQAQYWQNHLFRELLLLYAAEQVELSLEKKESQDDPLMTKARALIELQFEKPLSVEEVANRVGLSPVQLARRFRKAFGLNPSEFLSKLRLDKAVRLLTQTNLSLEEIAEQCGYSSGFYFSRVFRAKMNISPSRFREIYKV